MKKKKKLIRMMIHLFYFVLFFDYIYICLYFVAKLNYNLRNYFNYNLIMFFNIKKKVNQGLIFADILLNTLNKL